MRDADNEATTAGTDDAAELEAIGAIVTVLRPFGADARRRVIAFVADKYGVGIPGPTHVEHGATGGSGAAPTPAALLGYKHFAQLNNRVRPETDLYRTLLAAYWVQQVEKTSPFGTKQVNARLTEISVGLGHVTELLQALQDLKPSLVIHLNQPGKSKKSYLVTDEGVAAVDAAIRAGGFASPPRKGKSS